MKERKKMLVLPIKKKWFDMILSGEKKEEYREIKPYYDSRFSKYNIRSDYYKPIGTVLFRNGYSKSSPTLKCNVECAIDTGKTEWGAEPGKLYYVLKILNVEEIEDVK